MKKDLFILAIGAMLVSGCSSISPIAESTSIEFTPAIKKLHTKDAHLSLTEKIHKRMQSRPNFRKLTTPCEPGCN